MTATDMTGLLDAIRLDPADDCPRLVYADALDDNGECERAEFIRAQIALTRITDPCHCGEGPDPTGCGPCRERSRLWKQVDDVFRIDGWRWLALREKYYSKFTSVDCNKPDNFGISVREKGDDPEMSQTFHRGFVSVVRLPLAIFMKEARSLFAQHPIERVVLTDRFPSWIAWSQTDLSYGWQKSKRAHRRPERHNNYLTPAIWNWLKGKTHGSVKCCGDRATAVAFLERAATNYGRSLHKMPPLEEPS